MLAFGVPIGRRSHVYMGPVTTVFFVLFVGPFVMMYFMLVLMFLLVKVFFIVMRAVIKFITLVVRNARVWWRARHAAY